MDGATFTPDTAAMNRRRLLEQLAIIRSLFCKESSADDDAAATAAARNRNVVEGRVREGVRLINDQMAAVSTELLLTVMSDMMLLRLLDGLGVEEGRVVPSSDAASDQQLMLMDDAAAASATKKMKRAAVAAAKKKRYKRNKAAAKHKNKKIELMSWKGGGLISLIMMIAFGSITTLIFPLSLIHPSDGSGKGEAPPALPPSASKSLRQKDHRSNYDESDSFDMDIISPLPAVAVVSPSIFSPTVVGNRLMKSDELRASTSCVDTPGWKDGFGRGCDWYEEYEDPRCPETGWLAGVMGSASENCCFCGGGSSTCEDFRPKCQEYINVEGLGFEDGVVAPLCKEAESCSCEGVVHDVEIFIGYGNATLGLYNECKCDFWSRLCEDTGVGEACDYAAEYCCGDYRYYSWVSFNYRNSPACYCDFFNYAQNEFGHSLKPKALNISKEFTNPCGRVDWSTAIQNEKSSLEAIYEGTNGQSWTNNAGWMNETLDSCQWHGISCNVDGRVTGIDLRDNNLAGQFPIYTRNTSYLGYPVQENEWKDTKYGLANLYSLETLDLANNRLTGTIEYPPLYNLHSLTHFDVSGNQISGEANALVAPSLKHADLSNNYFTSMHFDMYKVSPLQSLRFCDVSNNVIQEQEDASYIFNNIPPNIQQFFASNNQFYGSLPESSNNLPALRQFDMSSNALSGELPDFAGSISSLQELDLSNQTNGITGSIPEDLSKFQSLRIMNLAGNKLAGTIPPAIVTMASLNILNLTDNELEGMIPQSIGDMTMLKVLDLSDNLLRSTIPSDVGNGKLKLLDLSNNTLTGTIPSQLVQLQGASILLKDNRFDNETAPLSLCLREVKEFDLAFHPTFCQIERKALVEFYDSAKGAKWTDESLWLDEDASYCDWKGVTCNVDGRVTKLHLANNGLSGRLSERIRNFNFIEELDLSDNDIEGSIPAEIDSLSYLTYLRLSSNAFTGSIPEDIDLLSKLTYLGLNGNAFNGSIPEDIWTSQSLKILSLAGNKLEGTIPPTIGNMTILEELDLSSNSLSGQIPFQIGQLGGAGVLKRLDLANNILSGTIPPQLGKLQNASILLEGNRFNNSAKTAPLSLCMLRNVKEFDLAFDATFCPIERNALSDFYDSAKGAEWTDRTNWLDGDEYASYCNWTGVTCNERSRVTKLNLANNGLSGRLSESIGNLTSIEVLDLSDNDMKGSIPAQIGNLTNLTYLRLSYNAFTGAAPESLGELTQLHLLQLQTNRITKIPNMPQLDENESIYYKSTFVTDCGVPTAFEEALECEHCTMCCNANEDCYPQEDTLIAEHLDLNYSTFAAVLIAGFVVFCCMVALSLYLFSKRKNRGNVVTMSTERRLEEDDKYALSRIGKESVYSYFVTDKVLGWLVAFATLGIQIGLLFVFVVASEVKLQDDKIDIQFTWKCPRDSDVCKNTADLAEAGWFIFAMLMIANLAKDMISGSKLIYHSSKVRHPLGSRIRYFIGGALLCSITLFALYVSIIYNKAIATSNTEIIVNSVVVLFVMDLDEWIFAALEACNEKWTKHAADSENSSSEAEKGGIIDEMQDKIVLQEAQIADQQKELMCQKEQIEQMARQFGQLTGLQDGVQNMQDSQAGSSASFETVFYCDPNANESVTSNADAVEPEDAQFADARESGKMTMNGTKMRNHYRKIKLGIKRGRPSKLNASSSGYNRL